MNLQIYIHVYKWRKVVDNAPFKKYLSVVHPFSYFYFFFFLHFIPFPFFFFFFFPPAFLYCSSFLSRGISERKDSKRAQTSEEYYLYSSVKRKVCTLAFTPAYCFIFAWGQSRIIYVDNTTPRLYFIQGELFFPRTESHRIYKFQRIRSLYREIAIVRWGKKIFTIIRLALLKDNSSTLYFKTRKTRTKDGPDLLQWSAWKLN